MRDTFTSTADEVISGKEIPKNVKWFFLLNKRFGFMTLLQFEKKPLYNTINTMNITSLAAKDWDSLEPVKQATCTYFVETSTTALHILQTFFATCNNLICSKTGFIWKYTTGPIWTFLDIKIYYTCERFWYILHTKNDLLQHFRLCMLSLLRMRLQAKEEGCLRDNPTYVQTYCLSIYSFFLFITVLSFS